jgi:PKD repeat protein
MDTTTGGRLRRVLLLDVREEGDTTPTQTRPDGLIRTSLPFNDEGAVVLPSGGSMLVVAPQDDGNRLQIDVDTTVDENGDGDPANDNDSAGTLFESNNTPLTLWFLEAAMGRQLAFTGIEDGRRQLVDVYGDAFARQQGIVSGNAHIVWGEDVDGNIQFSLRFDGMPPELPLLLHWHFGDSAESMQTSPMHWYSTNGDYTVTVAVINVINGETVATASQTVNVANAEVVTETSSSSAPAESAASVASVAASSAPVFSTPSSAATEEMAGGISWIFLAVIFIISMALGVVLLLLISIVRRRLRSIPEHIAAIEKMIVPTEGKHERKGSEGIKENEVIGEEKEEDEEKAEVMSPSAAPETPDWLSAGIDAVPPVPPAAQANAPEQTATSTEPTSAPTSKPEPLTPLEPSTTSVEPVPDWLQKGLDEAAQKGITAESAVPVVMDPLPETLPPSPPMPPSMPEEPKAAPAMPEPPVASPATPQTPPPTPIVVPEPQLPAIAEPPPPELPPAIDPTTSAPQPAEPSAQPMQTAPVPDWLKEQPSSSTPETSSASPAPSPLPAPQSVSDAPLPDWLKQEQASESPTQTADMPSPTSDLSPAPPSPGALEQPLATPPAEPSVGRPGESLPQRLSKNVPKTTQPTTQQPPAPPTPQAPADDAPFGTIHVESLEKKDQPPASGTNA